MPKKDKLPKTQRALRRAIFLHAAEQVLKFRMGACVAIDSFQYYPHLRGTTYEEEHRVQRVVMQCLEEFRSMFRPNYRTRSAFWLGPLTYGPMQDRRALALLLIREMT